MAARGRGRVVRALSRRVHRWLGLSIGVVFALIGLTGSVLVYYPEIDRALNPETTASPVESAWIDVDAIHRSLRAAEPGRQGTWRIEMPHGGGAFVNARYYRPIETADRGFAPLMLTVDPRTQRVTSRRFWGQYFVTWTYDLHYTLLMGATGRVIAGALGVGTLALLICGIVIWWPSARRWRAAFSIRLQAGRVRRVYDLHAVSGIWCAPLVLILVITGLVLEVPEWFTPAIEKVSPLTRPMVVADAGFMLENGHVGGDAVVREALGMFPGARVRWVETPGDGFPAWRVQLYQDGEPGPRFPRTNVWFDARTGAVLGLRDPRANSGSDTFMDWLHPLHGGEAFGAVGRLLAVLGGLVPVFALATGVIRWRHKARARARIQP